MYLAPNEPPIQRAIDSFSGHSSPRSPKDEPVQNSLQSSLGDTDSNVDISEAGRVRYQDRTRAGLLPNRSRQYSTFLRGFWRSLDNGSQSATTGRHHTSDQRGRSPAEELGGGSETSSSCRPIRSASPTSYIHTTDTYRTYPYVCEYTSPATDRGLALHETTPTLGEWTSRRGFSPAKPASLAAWRLAVES